MLFKKNQGEVFSIFYNLMKIMEISFKVIKPYFRYFLLVFYVLLIVESAVNISNTDNFPNLRNSEINLVIVKAVNGRNVFVLKNGTKYRMTIPELKYLGYDLHSIRTLPDDEVFPVPLSKQSWIEYTQANNLFQVCPPGSVRNYADYSHSQFGEDVYLFEKYFSKMKKHGVIVESGALDGFRYSNTILFECFSNWTSVHVEADPENFKALQLNRPNSINIHAALCSSNESVHFIRDHNAISGHIYICITD